MPELCHSQRCRLLPLPRALATTSTQVCSLGTRRRGPATRAVAARSARAPRRVVCTVCRMPHMIYAMLPCPNHETICRPPTLPPTPHQRIGSPIR
eukprot:scaffold35866_cov124-Isochrysis_galbana.AAC.6